MLTLTRELELELGSSPRPWREHYSVQFSLALPTARFWIFVHLTLDEYLLSMTLLHDNDCAGFHAVAWHRQRVQRPPAGSQGRAVLVDPGLNPSVLTALGFSAPSLNIMSCCHILI
jgi:hypothetical protein